ncbi:MAG: DNA/RNA nuclease SfsA, partial [Desulfobulbaceae bacterium]|nr:DNA/RNA nuclease SfsA [Desulfobulbaceae bacterium]
MKFTSPLIHGTLIKRYKRFLADITLDTDEIITAHCPNTGTMLSCSAPGSHVALSVSDNPKRKYPHTLEMIQVKDTWVGVNTSRTNKLVAEAIEKGQIAEFQDIDRIKAEVKVSEKSRLDLQLFHGEESTFVEIKNCSLAEDNCAMFPDAVTTRGTKHLNELCKLVEDGN